MPCLIEDRAWLTPSTAHIPTAAVITANCCLVTVGHMMPAARRAAAVTGLSADAQAISQ
jgi:hypothetical protein